MTKFYLPRTYKSNPEPAYEHDVQDGGVVYQPEVYTGALHRLEESQGRRLVIDVGCGRASKLVALEGVKTIGIDFGPNTAWLRETYPCRHWVDFDLERDFDLADPLIEGATVICADVVEHLRDPSALLARLAAWEKIAREVVVSTPARDLHYKKRHLGPPKNRCHVREWNLDEFGLLLRSFGLHPTLSLTQTCSRGPELETIQAICCTPTPPSPL